MKVLALVLAFGLVQGGEIPKKAFMKIANHHLMSSCWGEDNMMMYYKQAKDAMKECQQLSPSFDVSLFESPSPFLSNGNFQTLPAQFQRPNTLPGNTRDFNKFMEFMFRQYQQQNGVARRFRRAVEEPTPEEIEEFAEALADFKVDMKDNIGNVTCVLARLGALDKNLNVDLDHFTRGAWEEVRNVDPVLKSKFIEGARDCYAISQAIPQAILNKKPILKQFGRHMFFFKCMHKCERKLCAKKEMARWLELWYGPNDPSFNAQIGLPTDAYEAAPIAFKVMESQESDSEKFVGEFLFPTGM